MEIFTLPSGTCLLISVIALFEPALGLTYFQVWQTCVRCNKSVLVLETGMMEYALNIAVKQAIIMDGFDIAPGCQHETVSYIQHGFSRS